MEGRDLASLAPRTAGTVSRHAGPTQLHDQKGVFPIIDRDFELTAVRARVSRSEADGNLALLARLEGRAAVLLHRGRARLESFRPVSNSEFDLDFTCVANGDDLFTGG